MKDYNKENHYLWLGAYKCSIFFLIWFFFQVFGWTHEFTLLNLHATFPIKSLEELFSPPFGGFEVVYFGKFLRFVLNFADS